MIGGMCFAVPSTPYLSSHAPVEVLAVTYAIGAVFFTMAAFTQLTTTANMPRLKAAATPRSKVHIALVLGAATSITWWACLVQFAGTLFFNSTTIRAVTDTATTRAEMLVIWRPDAFGSICFLVASALALLDRAASRKLIALDWGSTDWWINWLNMIGSIFFGISAVAAWVLPDTTTPINAALVNSSTLAGALCFVFGAWLARPRDTAPQLTSTPT